MKSLCSYCLIKCRPWRCRRGDIAPHISGLYARWWVIYFSHFISGEIVSASRLGGFEDKFWRCGEGRLSAAVGSRTRIFRFSSTLTRYYTDWATQALSLTAERRQVLELWSSLLCVTTHRVVSPWRCFVWTCCLSLHGSENCVVTAELTLRQRECR